MEKLELKHLKHYLGTKLKFKHKSGEVYLNTATINLLLNTSLYSDPKLLLHPLSRLTEPILEGGKVPVDLIFEHAFGFEPNEKYRFVGRHKVADGEILSFHHADYSPLKSINSDPLKMPYEYFEMLVKWHFDVFGLIPKRLAIKKQIEK